MTAPKIGILMGSKSDAEVMGEAAKILEEFEVPYEIKVLSAHRDPKGHPPMPRRLKVVVFKC